MTPKLTYLRMKRRISVSQVQQSVAILLPTAAVSAWRAWHLEG